MGGKWTPVLLGDVCTKIGSGATPRGGSEVYLERGPFALIRSQNVYNDGFHRDGLAYIDEKHAAELEGVEVTRNDVLLSITGDFVARACQVDPGVVPARVNQHVAIIRPDAERLDPRFLRYVLVSPRMQARLLSWAGAGSTRNALTKAMIESLEVLAPEDIGEQRAIAHILGTLDDKIELNRRMSETLETMARALFKSWFVDFDPVRAKMEGRWQRGQSLPGLPAHLYDLFPDRLVDSELGEIPEGWEITELARILDIDPPRLLQKGQQAPYLDMASTPTQGHAPDQVVRRSYTSGARFMNGDTLLARITPSLENGKSAFVDFLKPGEVGWGSTEFIVLRPKPPLPVEFGYCLARYPDFREYAIQSMTGTSGRQRVQPSAIAKYPFARPSDSVARVFGELVQPLFARASHAVAESRTLAALRDVLLPKLISGELRVKDAERFLKERGL